MLVKFRLELDVVLDGDTLAKLIDSARRLYICNASI